MRHTQQLPNLPAALLSPFSSPPELSARSVFSSVPPSGISPSILLFLLPLSPPTLFPSLSPLCSSPPAFPPSFLRWNLSSWEALDNLQL